MIDIVKGCVLPAMKMLKRILSVFLIVLMLLCASGCALFQTEVIPVSDEEAAPYRMMAESFIEKLFEEDYVACYNLFGEDLASGWTRSDLQEQWEMVRFVYGDPIGVLAYEGYRMNGEGAIIARVAHKHGASSIQLIYDDENALVSLSFSEYAEGNAYSVSVPQGVTETELTLGEGTEYPLRAILSMPENAAEDVPCVVLVHDSGAYDLNSALGGNVPFADIAHGLALQGIAVLRYDKRTFAHADKLDDKLVMEMTVQEETIDDALLAVKAACAAQGVDPAKVYVAGHGLGGMLAPRIAVQSGGQVAGIVSLAGTARGYLDVVYDQNIAMTNDAEQKNAIKKEYKKVDNIAEQKDSATVFGLPVPYLKDLYLNPVSVQLDQLNIPVLVLQGKNDFQYTLDDYKSWQLALEGYAGKSELVLFENLNHLFADNTELKRRGTTGEYLEESHVAQVVVDTIAQWVKEN